MNVPLLLACAMVLVAGCPTGRPVAPLVSQPVLDRVEAEPDVTLTTYQAADLLAAGLKEPLRLRSLILATSFVDGDNLRQTSKLGRLLSRQVASRLSQLGFPMVETKVRGNMAINQAGEFILSRDLQEIEREYQAQAVLAGSYTVADRQIFVTLQLIRLKDQVVLSTSDFTLPVTSAMRTLLGIPPGVPMREALRASEPGHSDQVVRPVE